jgi:lysozyme
MIDLVKVGEDLKKDEGFRGCSYKCSAGKITIGYGHNIEDNPIPEHIADKLLQWDIGQAIRECESLSWFFLLSDIRKEVIINMMFNIGKGRLSGFKKMIAAIEQGDYEKAAAEMVDSKWYNQVGYRAVRLVGMMRDDERK